MSQQPLLQGRRTPSLDNSTEISLAGIPELLGVRFFHIRIMLFGALSSAVSATIVSPVPFVLHEIMEEYNVSKAHVILVASCVLFGSIAGALVIGSLCDRFGRKFTLMGCLIAISLLGLSHLIIPGSAAGFIALLVVRTCLGFCFGGITTATIPYAVEFISDSWRGKVAGIVQLGWALGSIFSILMAKAFQDNWRVVIALPAYTATICIIILLFCPESPRWLFIAGYEDNGYNVLRTILSSAALIGHDNPGVNGHCEVPRIVIPLVRKQTRALSEQFGDLLSSKVWKVTICACILFVATAGSSYGIATWMPLILKDLTGDKEIQYELFIWSDISSFLGTCVATVLLDSLGRKLSYIGAGVVSAVCKGSFPFVASQRSPMFGIHAIVILDSFFVTIAWAAMNLYITEAFPTTLRGTGAGTAAFFGRLSAAVSPILVGLILEESVYWAFALVSGLMFFGALTALMMLEETANAQLVDDVSSDETSGKV